MKSHQECTMPDQLHRVTSVSLPPESRVTAMYTAVNIFKVYSKGQTEIILGEDDKHLDFRLSLLFSEAALPFAKLRLILSTVVHCHNRLGRLYIFAIAPFHRLLVRSSMRHAARLGWRKAV